MTATTLPEQLSDPARAFLRREHGLLIGGERHPAADGRTFDSLDPATGAVIATLPQAGAADVDRAVAAARAAFAPGSPWRPMSARDRGRRLTAFADLVGAHARTP